MPTLTAIPQRVNLELYETRDTSVRIEFREDSVPIDVSTWAFKSQIRASQSRASELLHEVEIDMTYADLSNVDPELQGVVFARIPAKAISQDGYWDVLVDDGEMLPVCYGNVTLVLGVTDA